MGNCPYRQGSSQVIEPTWTRPPDRGSNFNRQVEDEGGGRFSNERAESNTDQLTSDLYEGWLKEFQESNFQSMKFKFKKNKNLFFLDQILLTIQFFPNFSESSIQAEGFKIEKEFSMNSRLRNDSIGQYKVSLLHGIGSELSKTFIYRPSTHSKLEDEEGGQLDETQSLLMSEEILPLEFFVTPENMHVHTEREYDDIIAQIMTNNETSDSFIKNHQNCLCMQEEPEIKGDYIQLGFVRLYREETPRIRSRPLKERGSESTEFSFRRESDLSSAVHSEQNGSLQSDAEDNEVFRASRRIPGKSQPVILPSIQENSEKSDLEPYRSVLAQDNKFSKAGPSRYHKTIFVSHGPPSSGYGTSQASTSTSLSQSTQIRTRWLRDHLSELSKYQTESTQTNTQLPSDCYTEVLIENDDESPKNETSSSNSESYSDSDSESSTSNAKFQSPRNSSADFIRKKYLNPGQFSWNFCGEFEQIGRTLGMTDLAMTQAQVTGITIRCIENQDGFKQLYTFTPCLKTKQWPRKFLLGFIHRKVSKSKIQNQNSDDDRTRWPTKDQIQNIAHDLGCNLIPLSPPLPPNPKLPEPLDWLTNFSQGETALLNDLKHPHFRTYIFLAIIFRAFIAIKGPRGIGLDHIRNILYQTWEKDFIYWNDEEQGEYLKKILDKLYNCLGRNKMSNFFIPKQNMLRNIPKENSYLIQGFLSKIRENLSIYCILALKNLKWMQSEDELYPKFDLQKLYNLMTVQSDGALIYIANPRLAFLGPPPETQRDKGNKKNKRKNSNSKVKSFEELSVLQEEFSLRRQPLAEPDKNFERTQRRFRRWKKKQDKMKAQEEASKSPTNVKTPKEKKEKINLERFPVPKFTTLRTVMIIELFIKHFLKMAAQSIVHKAWSEATMYTMHVQNLCRLLREMELGGTNMSETQIDEYWEESLSLKHQLGPRMKEYVRCKISHLLQPDESPEEFFSHQNSSYTNFYFQPKDSGNSATPSTSHYSSVYDQSPRPKIVHPRVAESLRSFQSGSDSLMRSSTPTSSHREELEMVDLGRFSRGQSSSLIVPYRVPRAVLHHRQPQKPNTNSNSASLYYGSGRETPESSASVLY